jgi:uncharacterized protein (UPF0332 family)
MSFDWNTYIALAKTLNALPHEAAKRSAVSRAYYGAFHRASDTLKTRGIQTFPKDNKKSHAKIWNVYKESANRACRKIGVRGALLMDDRHDADYNAARTFDSAEVTTYINDIETLVTDIAVPANLPQGFIGPLQGGLAPSPIIRAIQTVRRIFRV